jgi:hypothetical protein
MYASHKHTLPYISTQTVLLLLFECHSMSSDWQEKNKEADKVEESSKDTTQEYCHSYLI